MKSSSFQRLITLSLAICLVTVSVTQTVHAAIITSDTAVELSDRNEQIIRVNQILARDSVRNAMIRFGVDPSDASTRVQSLTNEELEILEESLSELPAGGTGVVEVVGIVAIVLIILELLNVTNIFSAF